RSRCASRTGARTSAWSSWTRDRWSIRARCARGPRALRVRAAHGRPRRPPHGEDHGLGDLPPLGPAQRVRAREAQGRRGPLALMEVPVVFQYQRALDDFRRAGEASPLLKRMSELISLLDLTTTLNSGLSRGEILDAALLIVMG